MGKTISSSSEKEQFAFSFHMSKLKHVTDLFLKTKNIINYLTTGKLAFFRRYFTVFSPE
jgi:hypothetical protein